MNIREAILKAADHIERNPGDFNFNTSRVPHPCKTPGCALGWVGFFLRVEGEDDFLNRTALVCGVPALKRGGFTRSEGEFYFRMNQFGIWFSNAAECARCLRLYADKYHRAPKLGIPASVRAIFDAPAIEPVCEGDAR